MILAILSFIAGAALIATGIYFLTPGFLEKMNFRYEKQFEIHYEEVHQISNQFDHYNLNNIKVRQYLY